MLALMAAFTVACLVVVMAGVLLPDRWLPWRIRTGRMEGRRRLERTDPVWGWRSGPGGS